MSAWSVAFRWYRTIAMLIAGGAWLFLALIAISYVLERLRA